MDNDFIKIDDLLRQRLSGGEEQVRSGSWMNMRDLLDKEMPQEKPAGLLYWRRTFSVVAVLSLLTTVGVGGYELSNSLSNRYTGDATAFTGGETSMKPGTGSSSAEMGDVYKTQAADDAITANRGTQPIALNVTENTNNNTAPENSNVAGSKAVNNVNADVAANRNNRLAHKNVLAHPLSNTNTANNNPVAENTIAAADHKTASKPVASLNIPETGKKENTNNTITPSVKLADAADKTRDIAVANATNNNNKNTIGVDKLALGSGTPVNTAATGTAALKSVAVAGKAADATANTANRDNKAATNNKNTTASKTSVAANTAPVSHSTSITSKSIISRIGVAPRPMSPVDDKAEAKALSMISMSKGKKVIERMVLHERFVKTSNSDGYFKLDTISVETLTTDLGLKIDNATHTRTYSKSAAANASANEKAKAGANENDNDDDAAATNSKAAGTNSKIVPAATTSGAKLKAAPAAKKITGSTTVQKLNAAFNDIKYNFGAPKFHTGITAGVNGAFLGNNNFKGFQFGITGDLVFNDKVSVISEIKYFHRVNGNTSINDDYSTYTPAAGGQYTKQEHQSAYSFSALHSIEMPIAIRYAIGNLALTAGGNLVYNFGINTGAEVIPGGATSTVAAPGADTAPLLSERDFMSRIGLGYMVGLSYNVGHGTTLDVRSVQTVWDNATSTGGRMISNQLYKSPSLQLSIIYHFGKNNE